MVLVYCTGDRNGRSLCFCFNDMRLLICVFIVYLLWACGRRERNVVVVEEPLSFEVKELKSELFSLEEELLDPRMGIYFCNESVFMIGDWGDEKGFLHFYDFDSGELIGKYGRSGRGPDEYLLPRINIFKDSAIINSITKRAIFSLKDAGQYDSLAVKPWLFYKETTGANYFYPLNDSLAIFNITANSQQYSLLNRITGQVRSWSAYPENAKTELLSQKVKQQVFSKAVGISPNGQYLVSVYLAYPIVDILNLSDFTTFRHIWETKYKNDFTYDKASGKVNFIDFHTMYGKVVMADTSFYVLYLDSSVRKQNTEEATSEIHQFDYSGRLLSRFRLDVPVFAFCVYEKKKCILALAKSEEHIPVLLKYTY